MRPTDGGGDAADAPKDLEAAASGAMRDEPALTPPGDAAQWFARMHSGEVTEDERRAFAAWLEADPANALAYRRHRFYWDLAGAVPAARLVPAALPPPPGAMRAGWSRRRLGLTLLGLGSVVGLAAWSRSLLDPTPRFVLGTRRGERRQSALPDGSLLDMNSETRVVVAYRDDERRVELLAGEALFDVRADASRPFVVDGGLGEVIVTGTRFNVRRDAAALQVSVDSGAVRVRSGPWWRRSERRLAAGQQTLAFADHTLSPARSVDVAQIVAWQRGRVVFDNASLSSVLREMNRYLPQPATLLAPELAEHRVSGVFSVDDPDALIDALPAIAPVAVVRLVDGRVRVTRR